MMVVHIIWNQEGRFHPTQKKASKIQAPIQDLQNMDKTVKLVFFIVHMLPGASEPL